MGKVYGHIRKENPGSVSEFPCQRDSDGVT